MQGALSRFVIAPGDFHCHGDRKGPFLDGRDQPLLPILEQAQKAANIFDIEIGLAGDFTFAIATPAKVADLLHQLALPVLAPGDILHQAHDQQSSSLASITRAGIST
jgi:hypothetical protein